LNFSSLGHFKAPAASCVGLPSTWSKFPSLAEKQLYCSRRKTASAAAHCTSSATNREWLARVAVCALWTPCAGPYLARVHRLSDGRQPPGAVWLTSLLRRATPIAAARSTRILCSGDASIHSSMSKHVLRDGSFFPLFPGHRMSNPYAPHSLSHAPPTHSHPPLAGSGATHNEAHSP
jgi:hypothetical protein